MPCCCPAAAGLLLHETAAAQHKCHLPKQRRMPQPRPPSCPPVAPPMGIRVLGMQFVGFLAPRKIQTGRDATECSQAKLNTRFPSLSLSFQKLCSKLSASQRLARIDSWFISTKHCGLRDKVLSHPLHFLPQLRPGLSQYPLEMMLSDDSILSPTERTSVLRLLYPEMSESREPGLTPINTAAVTCPTGQSKES